MGVGHPDPEVPTDAVGRRVLCGADRATVRYVGPVPPTTGQICLPRGVALCSYCGFVRKGEI